MDTWKRRMVFWITHKPDIQNQPNRTVITFTKNGKLHNVGLPACIEKYSHNGKIILKYYKNGKPIISTRNNLMPWFLSYFEIGKIREISYRFVTRKEVPPNMNYTEIEYYNTGVVKHLRFCIEYELSDSIPGKIPARRSYYPDSNIKKEMYYYKDEIHRIGKPAIIKYYPNGNIHYEKYHINDVVTRPGIDNPECIFYYKSGARKMEIFCKGCYSDKRICYNKDGTIILNPFVLKWTQSEFSAMI